MVSRRPPDPVEKANPAWMRRPNSPLEKTPHKTSNGDLSITCRNRHCPKCQITAKERWIEQSKTELLPITYFHAVFTLPAAIAEIALRHKKTLFGILFRASAETLLRIAADPKHLGAHIGFFSILHTWEPHQLRQPEHEFLLEQFRPDHGDAQRRFRSGSRIWRAAQHATRLAHRVLATVPRDLQLAIPRTS